MSAARVRHISSQFKVVPMNEPQVPSMVGQKSVFTVGIRYSPADDADVQFQLFTFTVAAASATASQATTHGNGD